MSNKLLSSVIRHSISLAVTALIVAIIMAIVYLFTREKIASQVLQNEQVRLAEIFPASEHNNNLLNDPVPLLLAGSPFRNLDLLDLRQNRVAYLARDNETISGIILPAVAREGYNGDIQLLVGIRSNGEITGVRVSQHRETPGLGDKVELRISDWILDFDGRSLASTGTGDWAVRKAGGDFDQFTGATVTPRAVIRKVRDVLEFYELNQDILSGL